MRSICCIFLGETKHLMSRARIVLLLHQTLSSSKCHLDLTLTADVRHHSSKQPQKLKAELNILDAPVRRIRIKHAKHRSTAKACSPVPCAWSTKNPTALVSGTRPKMLKVYDPMRNGLTGSEGLGT